MSQSALVLLLPGLGDALTASPAVRRIASADYTVDALTMLRPVTEYAQALGVFRDVFELPLLTNPRQSLAPLVRLRRKRYDSCIVPFPATRWQYAAVASLVGARSTVIHNYGGLSAVITSTARPLRVDLQGGHRSSENDRLADAMRLPQVAEQGYLIPDSWVMATRPGLIGVHTGSMVYKGNEARRWPFENFLEVAKAQLEAGRTVRVFVGPNEKQDAELIPTRIPHANLEIVQRPLRGAAQALAECEVFLGNDAGLAHLAAGLGVKTVAIFGMTNSSRAFPIGKSLVVRPSTCPPCHDEGMRNFECVRKIDFRCLREDASVPAVLAAVDRAFMNDLPWVGPQPNGCFRLYGRSLGGDVAISSSH